MIIHMGVRTTESVRVAYRALSLDEAEAPAIAELMGCLTRQNPHRYDAFDHSMVIYHDPPGTPDRRREILIPVDGPVSDVETRVLPSMRVAFVVFKGTDWPIERYYEFLQGAMERGGNLASDEFYSMEIMYVPESVDEQDYTMEIMIPLAG